MLENIEMFVTKRYIFIKKQGEDDGFLMVINKNTGSMVSKLNIYENSYVRWVENGFIHIETEDTSVIDIFNGITEKFYNLNLTNFEFVHTDDSDSDNSDSDSDHDYHHYDDNDIQHIFDDLLAEKYPWDLEIYEHKLTMISEQGKFVFPLVEDDKIYEIIVRNIDPL
jgi:hypothetical protein